jgi:hypothetical protein
MSGPAGRPPSPTLPSVSPPMYVPVPLHPPAEPRRTPVADSSDWISLCFRACRAARGSVRPRRRPPQRARLRSRRFVQQTSLESCLLVQSSFSCTKNGSNLQVCSFLLLKKRNMYESILQRKYVRSQKLERV